MYSILSRSSLLAILLCCVLFSLSAFVISKAPELNSYQLIQINRPAHASPTRIPIHTRTPIPRPSFLTACPATGQARAAVMLHYATDKRQSLVYTYNSQTAALLIRYDIGSRQKTTLVSLNNAIISNAQLSTDGQFVLFATQVTNRLAIQMVRIDGQELQTLYCTPENDDAINFIDNLLWSPDQQTIVFRIPDPTHAPVAPIIKLLHVDSGQVQTILVPQAHTGYIPEAWFGNTHVYLQGYSTDQGVSPQDVYLLDTPNGTIKRVAQIQGYGWDLCPTAKGNELLLSQSAFVPQEDEPLPPSIISAQPALGGRIRVIYASHVHAVTQVRSISAKTLLFVLGGRFASGAQDGLWKINSDGSGLTLLTRDGKLLSNQHTIWSSVSRNGRLYAVIGYDYTPASNTLLTHVLYGALNGGPTTLIATAQTGESAEIVGWTTV
jgi:eukaryotic-like serine/threonine-protein kinase